MVNFESKRLKSFRFAALTVTGVVACLALSSCEGKGEEEDLASAQSCLDSVPQSNPAAAEACLPMVEGYASTRANALKCSIYMTSGGLVESRIVTAYNALKNQSDQNKEATFMASLSLDLPNVDGAYLKAIEGNRFCTASGSRGLIYVGAAVVAGTYLNKTLQDLTGANFNPQDPAATAALVKNLLTACTGNSADPKCSTNLATLGATTVLLADSYCGTASADQAVCGKINSAVLSAYGDNAKVGKALYCYLAKKTYDAVNNACL